MTTDGAVYLDKPQRQLSLVDCFKAASCYTVNMMYISGQTWWL